MVFYASVVKLGHVSGKKYIYSLVENDSRVLNLKLL